MWFGVDGDSELLILNVVSRSDNEENSVTCTSEKGFIRYKGEHKNGFAHGKGRLVHSNGETAYFGSFKKGKKDGFGMEFTSKGIKLYEGNFKEDKYHYQGVIFYDGPYGFVWEMLLIIF